MGMSGCRRVTPPRSARSSACVSPWDQGDLPRAHLDPSVPRLTPIDDNDPADLSSPGWCAGLTSIGGAISKCVAAARASSEVCIGSRRSHGDNLLGEFKRRCSRDPHSQRAGHGTMPDGIEPAGIILTSGLAQSVPKGETPWPPARITWYANQFAMGDVARRSHHYFSVSALLLGSQNPFQTPTAYSPLRTSAGRAAKARRHAVVVHILALGSDGSSFVPYIGGS